jgi:hypothetical protein
MADAEGVIGELKNQHALDLVLQAARRSPSPTQPAASPPRRRPLRETSSPRRRLPARPIKAPRQCGD